jgi:methionine-rich copper-binding protein CopC
MLPHPRSTNPFSSRPAKTPAAGRRAGLPSAGTLLQRACAGLFISLLALAIAGSVALAHARFDHSTPSPGQVLTAAPSNVEIFTVQDMRKTAGSNQITVTGPDGSRVDDGATVVDDTNRRHFSAGLKQGLGSGRYAVNFQTLSDEDGEVDHGSFAFYVGVQPTTDQKAQDAKLTLTSKTEDAPTQSHTGLYIAVAIAAALVLLVVAGGLTLLRGRNRAR